MQSPSLQVRPILLMGRFMSIHGRTLPDGKDDDDDDAGEVEEDIYDDTSPLDSERLEDGGHRRQLGTG